MKEPKTALEIAQEHAEAVAMESINTAEVATVFTGLAIAEALIRIADCCDEDCNLQLIADRALKDSAKRLFGA